MQSREIKPIHILLIIVASLAIGILWAITSTVDWSEFTLNIHIFSCNANRKNSKLNSISYNVLFIFFIYVMPLSIMIYSSIQVLSFVSFFFRKENCQLNKLVFYQSQEKGINEQIAFLHI